jgi:hypothetical protein
MCSVSRPSTNFAIKDVSQVGYTDLLGRPITQKGTDKKTEGFSADGEIPTPTNPNPQNTTTSTPTVEKEMLSDRLTSALKAMDEKIDAIKSMAPSAADQLASQMANQPPMTPPSSFGSSPSPSPSSPSSSRPSSSGSPELKNTLTSLRGALKEQDKQIANLEKALVNRDNKFDPLRPPKFGDEKKSEEKTKVAESKSEDTTKEKSEAETKLAETIPKKDGDELLAIDFPDDTPNTETEQNGELA